MHDSPVGREDRQSGERGIHLTQAATIGSASRLRPWQMRSVAWTAPGIAALPSGCISPPAGSPARGAGHRQPATNGLCLPSLPDAPKSRSGERRSQAAGTLATDGMESEDHLCPRHWMWSSLAPRGYPACRNPELEAPATLPLPGQRLGWAWRRTGRRGDCPLSPPSLLP